MTFIPQVGGYVTVTLPGEMLRAPVQKVIDRNNVFVTLPQPMAKGHNYRLGDLVHCQRTPDALQGHIWRVVEHRTSTLTPAIEQKAAALPAQKAAAKSKAKPAAPVEPAGAKPQASVAVKKGKR